MRSVWMSLAVLCLLAAVGCWSPQVAFVTAMDENWKAITPEYVAYIDHDPALTPEQKLSRHRMVDFLWKAIDAAKTTPTPPPANPTGPPPLPTGGNP